MKVGYILKYRNPSFVFVGEEYLIDVVIAIFYVMQTTALMQQALAEMNGSSHVQHGSEVAPQKTVSEADYYASPYAALSASIQHSAKRFRIDKEGMFPLIIYVY